MRAKEYLEHLHQVEKTSGLVEAAYQVFVQMSVEMGEIIKARQAQRPSAVMAVLDEMNNRWNAMRKKDPRIPRDEFKNIYLKELAAKKEVDDPVVVEAKEI